MSLETMSRPSTILIVEDDIALAEITCDVIALGGVTAVYRANIRDAIDYLAQNAGSTVGLFTDVNLLSPMGGIELAVYVAQEWPGVAICVTSGVSHERPMRLPEKARYLPKPWSASDLIAFAEEAARR